MLERIDMDFEQEWLLEFSDFDKMAKTIGVYSDRKRYVGAAGDWKSQFIPRYVMGIDLNPAAYRHDYKYTIGGTPEDRFNSDAAFLTDMMQLIELKPWKWWQPKSIMKYFAREAALKYFMAVREFGKDHYNFLE